MSALVNRVRNVFALAAAAAVAGCALDPEAPGHLVPPTAAEDPDLPQLTVEVAGRPRALHLQATGDPAAPALLALPGGPGADFRLLLPIEALADRYRVVLWDPVGAGLSERVPAEELTYDGLDEEIDAVRRAMSPAQPVVLLGHSFGADLAVRYAARHPDAVAALVLVEPGPFTARGRDAYGGGTISFLDGQDFFWVNELLSSADHATIDFKALTVIREANRSFYCDQRVPRPDEYPMWRFGGYAHHVLMFERPIDDMRWTDGIERYGGPILIVAGTCGAAGADFQRTYNLPELPGAGLVTVEGAGHVTLFTEASARLLEVVRGFLEAAP